MNGGQSFLSRVFYLAIVVSCLKVEKLKAYFSTITCDIKGLPAYCKIKSVFCIFDGYFRV